MSAPCSLSAFIFLRLFVRFLKRLGRQHENDAEHVRAARDIRMISKCQAVTRSRLPGAEDIHLSTQLPSSAYSSSLCQAQTECWEPRLKTKFRVNPGWPPNGGTATAHLLAVGVPAVPDLVRSRSFWDMAEGDLAAEVIGMRSSPFPLTSTTLGGQTASYCQTSPRIACKTCSSSHRELPIEDMRKCVHSPVPRAPLNYRQICTRP